MGNTTRSSVAAEGVLQIINMTGNGAVDKFQIPITDGQLNILVTAGKEGAVAFQCYHAGENDGGVSRKRPSIRSVVGSRYKASTSSSPWSLSFSKLENDPSLPALTDHRGH